MSTLHKIDGDDYWGRIPESKRALIDRAQEIGMNVGIFVMGEDHDDSPAVAALRMDPGAVTYRHSHPCERVEVVVQGTLLVGDEVLKPGDVMVSRPDEMYGPHYAGPEGCVTLEVFGRLDGVSRTTYDTPNGAVTLDMDSGVMRPDDVIG